MDQHGLVYPPHLLDALPVLHPKAPVRALSAAQFADVHLQHTLAHPPDNVLFPFLHGLEGDNHAQNTFFASSAFSSASGNRQAHHDNTRITPRVPPYRGLVWVVCEEDLERAGDHVTLRVLRRKPAPAPGVAVGAAAGAEPTPSSSSDDSDGDDSEEDSVYGDEAVDEDEQDMLLMMEAQAAAAAAASQAIAGTGAGPGDKAVPAPAFAISIDTTITPPPHAHAHAHAHTHGHGHASRRPSTASNSTSTSTSNSNSSSTTPSSPDLALDTGDDDEDVDSVLASPTLQIPMQVDAVHVVQSSEDADALALADGILDSVGPLSGGKDEKHFAGTHMHPVAHRPTPVPVLPSTLAGGVVAGAGAGVTGLGISTAINTNTTAIATTEAIAIDMLSTSSSSASASASASASSSRSPASSSSTSSSASSNSSSPSAASSPSEEADKQLHLDLSSSPPQEPQPPSSDITPSPQLPSSQAHQHQTQSQHQYQPKQPTNPAAPPLLTSTFRPKELLRRSRAPRVGTGTGQAAHNRAHAQTRPQNQIRIPGRVVSSALGGPMGPMGRRKEKDDKDRERDRDRDREEEGWEFVPARVPDGISLRNFGIQVPIYATLSDVIVYSPYGATPAALALARRFKTAIRTKRAERLQAAGLGGDSSEDEDEDMQHLSEEERDTKKREKEERDRRRAEFLEYNVFVLDAEEEEMRKAVPYLMMRVCGAGVPGGVTPHSLGQGQASASPSDAAGTGKDQEFIGGASDRDALVDIGAHTDGPDGHLIELGLVEAEARRQRKKEIEEERAMEEDMVVDVDMITDADAMDVDCDEHQKSVSSSSSEKANQDDDEARKDFVDNLHLIPNTVDFALREREEMRDLTKASEIISLPPLAAAVPLVAAVPLSSSSSTSTTTATANPNDTRPNSPRSIVPPPLNHASTSTHSTSSTHTHLDADGDPSPVWDPRVGQVYLGNSGDVPLAPDVPSHFRHAASVPREEEAEEWDWAALTGHLKGLDGLEGYDLEQEGDEEATTKTRTKKLSEDDPFYYLSTNDPARGFGYDICVECHDLAPFPSGQHLRAAEEHLGMLDVMWRERWEKAWAAARERSHPPAVPELAVEFASDDGRAHACH
ncbi:hypothetical protein GALMADRAFT_456206 [Galerina marginata CBS 339.88]|uniref:Uncharacterized protein n=1 Tax=Galerina marginata (strain CBS 339.88) TaxID=685588 RepID=A0A067T113_GALM3|nr:hypothetical protein GALMADRAFT_456206 [Galerina marginata CBS 339.88]